MSGYLLKTVESFVRDKRSARQHREQRASEYQREALGALQASTLQLMRAVDSLHNEQQMNLYPYARMGAG